MSLSAFHLMFRRAMPTLLVFSDSEMLPEDLANQSVLLKEQQLVKEGERVRHALMHHYRLINFALI
jgi:hypothetical protein